MKAKKLKFFYRCYIYFLSSIILFFPLKKENESINSNIIFCDSIKYDKGYIYVLYNNEDIEMSSNDLLIIDETNQLDANIKLKNSYKITNINEMKEIIELIKCYSGDTTLNRTNESMLNEWIIHNILYFLNVEKERTKNVDFNNDDEKYYSFAKIIKH